MNLIIAGVVIWVGWLLLRGSLHLVGEMLSAVGLAWGRTRPRRDRIVGAIESRTQAVGAQLRGYDLSLPFWSFVLFVVGCAVLIGLNSRLLVSSVDRMFGRTSPLLGWAVIGLGVGIVTGIASRALELGWLGRRSWERVPDISHLRAGEAAASRHFRLRKVAVAIALIVVVAALCFSILRSGKYDREAPIDRRIAAIATFASRGDVFLLNSALEDAVDNLNEHPMEGIGLLAAVRSLDKQGADPAIAEIAQVASSYLDTLRDETEKAVSTGSSDALARSEAFSQFDQAASLKWRGRLYAAGRGGAREDLVKAFSLYSEAAALGDARAEELRNGLSRRMVSSKDGRARGVVFAYLQSKAQSGGPADHYWLGEWYVKSGTPEDQKIAELWLVNAMRQDADQNIRYLAFTSLNQLESTGISAKEALDDQALLYIYDKDRSRKNLASSYLERRAATGYPEAMLWMGRRYATGDGVTKDLSGACDWFLKTLLQAKESIAGKEALDEWSDRKCRVYVDGSRILNSGSVRTNRSSLDLASRVEPAIQPDSSNEVAPAIPSAEARSEIPDNASQNAFGNGWVCNPGWHRSGNECVQVQLPANAELDYTGHGWTCRRGYRQVGSGCAGVVMPENGELDYTGHGWTCRRGYRQVGSDCTVVVMPENGELDYTGHGWTCRRGYRQVGSGCTGVVMPENGELDYTGHGWTCRRGYGQVGSGCSAVVIPENGELDYTGHGWTCRRGYRQAGKACVPVGE